MSQITIYHNPQCGTSRNTLELIRNSGEEPTVIEYLQTPPDRTTLVRLIKDMGIEVRALLRIKGSPRPSAARAARQLRQRRRTSRH